MTEPHWVSDGTWRLIPLHQPLPAPWGEVLSGWPLLFLSPHGSRLAVTSYIVVIPDPQQSLFLCLHPFLLFFTSLPRSPFCNTQYWSREPLVPSSSLLLLLLLLPPPTDHQTVKLWNSLWKVNSRESINNLWGSILWWGESKMSPS